MKVAIAVLFMATAQAGVFVDYTDEPVVFFNRSVTTDEFDQVWAMPAKFTVWWFTTDGVICQAYNYRMKPLEAMEMAHPCHRGTFLVIHDGDVAIKKRKVQ